MLPQIHYSSIDSISTHRAKNTIYNNTTATVSTTTKKKDYCNEVNTNQTVLSNSVYNALQSVMCVAAPGPDKIIYCCQL